MKINELSQKYHISVRTLRYYDEIGLLFSTRNSSNIREFSSSEVERLELILFLKNLNFSLHEIKEILTDTNFNNVRLLFKKRMSKLSSEISRLNNQKQILLTILNILSTGDSSKRNIKEFIKEQIYFQNNNERMLNMNNDHIILEIGEDLIPLADVQVDGKLLNSIKNLRLQIEKKYKSKVDLIRVRDNPDVLTSNEYRILKDGNEVVRKTLDGSLSGEQNDIILADIKKIILELI